MSFISKNCRYYEKYNFLIDYRFSVGISFFSYSFCVYTAQGLNLLETFFKVFFF